VEELEPVWVGCGWRTAVRHPQHTQDLTEFRLWQFVYESEEKIAVLCGSYWVHQLLYISTSVTVHQYISHCTSVHQSLYISTLVTVHQYISHCTGQRRINVD
jgi:hypothetical protein